MVKMRILSTVLLLSGLCATAYAEWPDGDTRSGIFSPTFHSLQIYPPENDQLPPIIRLNSHDRLVVKFDEIADERRYMRYQLRHCNSAWQPDGLIETEYLDGFNEEPVEDYAYSAGTKTHYVNYSITIPNANMCPLVSGNYLLRVYDEENPEETLLQVRFYVVEPLITMSTDVTSRTDVDYNNRHQQLKISVDAEKLDIRDYFSDLWLVISQNSREDNQQTIAHPLRVTPPVMHFESNPALIFSAGNEYRRFETVSTTYPGMGVESVGYAEPYYHFQLFTDTPRSDGTYNYDRTQHGRYRVREYNSSNSDTEAEYGITHFTLDMPELHNADVFIDGDLMLRRFDPESRMVYNRATRLYEASPLLKQGSYNYQYLVVPRNGSTTGSTALVEGDFYETVNEYMIRVYYRKPGERYDRLVGVGTTLSGR